jgi:hypothetical protein
MALAVINGKNVRIARNMLDARGSGNGGSLIDIEPNAATDRAEKHSHREQLL